MKRITTPFAALLLLLIPLSSVRAGTTYSTFPDWHQDFTLYQSNLGTTTVGQTFIAPSDNVLTDFTFELSSLNTTHLQYEAEVFAWTGPLKGHGGNATGSALFTSGPFTFDGDGDEVFQTVTFNTGLTPLIAGQNYVAFLTTSNPVDYAASSGGAIIGALDYLVHGANDGGGDSVYDNNSNDPSLLTSQPWSTFADDGDLSWSADFTTSNTIATPEPATLISALAGCLLGMVVLRRRTS